MLKFIIAFERRPGLTRPETHEYLANVHGPLVASVPEFCRHARGYVQNFAYEAGLPEGAFEVDGAAELWFDDSDSFVTAYAEPRYLELVRPDEPRFANPERMVAAFTAEAGIVDRPGDRAVKLFRFLAGGRSSSDGDFAAIWRERYGQRVATDATIGAPIVKYIQNWSHPASDDPFPLARSFAGVDEFWFETEEALLSFVEKEAGLLGSLAADGIIDLEESVAFAAREKQVIP